MRKLGFKEGQKGAKKARKCARERERERERESVCVCVCVRVRVRVKARRFLRTSDGHFKGKEAKQ